eukprot:8672987-Pyramimonas_sp.AAC.1
MMLQQKICALVLASSNENYWLSHMFIKFDQTGLSRAQCRARPCVFAASTDMMRKTRPDSHARGVARAPSKTTGFAKNSRSTPPKNR